MKRLSYRFPADFSHSLSSSFINAVIENAPRLNDAIMQRCEALTREKQAKMKVRWEKRFGEKYPFRFDPSASHLRQAIKEASPDTGLIVIAVRPAFRE